MTDELQTKEWYAEYYRKHGQWRNNVLRNPEVVFQLFANDAAVIKALRSTSLNPAETDLLDVGCGNGVGLLGLARCGFPFRRMTGIDLQANRLDEARQNIPSANLVHGDAAAMPFASASFDLVFESTMFVQLTDEPLASCIASEMLRVCKPDRYIILSDWRYSMPFSSQYLGLSRIRVARLFSVGKGEAAKCTEHARYRAALVPPLGRRLSHYASPLYFLVHGIFPFLSGHIVTVLRRSSVPTTKS